MLILKTNWIKAILILFIILIFGFIDWITGYNFNFFVFYFLPVSLAAWVFGPIGAVSVSIFCTIVWFISDFYTGHYYISNWHAVWNTMIRLTSFISIGWTVSKQRSLFDKERDTSQALRKSLSEIKVLETILPICAECKKIRDSDGNWQQIEVYIGQRSNTQFSHGYCPDCARQVLEAAGLTKKEG